MGILKLIVFTILLLICKDETGAFTISEVDDSRFNGKRWLLEKWSPSAGWRENTHRGIIAWHLATKGITTGINSDKNLMVKQLEVLTLASLLRTETDPLTANQLSMYINAMIVTCKNPRNFYGFDLLKLLEEEIETSSITTHPVAYLALCNAGETLEIKKISDLCIVLNDDWSYPFFLVQAAAVMALSCIRTSQQDVYAHCTDYDPTIKKFKQLQLEDGSFGNIYTTAIVTQALLSAGEGNNKDWKLNAAVKKSLSDVRNINCSIDLRHKSKGDSAPDVRNKLVSQMRVRYTVYIGDKKDRASSITLRTPENITVFQIMQLAEKADSKYKFQWKKMGEKLYIYDIAGIINDFENGLFWLLYVGKDANSINQATENIALSEPCNQLTDDSGTIFDDKYAYSYSVCWKIIIPSNSYVQLSMESFSNTRTDCSYSKVEVSIANYRNDNFVFCPGVSQWQPILAFNDVTVTHYINSGSYVTSKFSMNYRLVMVKTKSEKNKAMKVSKINSF
ncbi:hypothetical protein HNY73_021653 [Argiope bruennichi]|uniref:Uncharacterized protein n=1 Tax=Argiope bruennichi TaxID=94029 RepID=A0A8T0DZT0_ARGBR|nr:hypothetical protein HNY73_021653 [Argiope bruennichi]